MSVAADESSLLSLRPPCTELKCALTILLSESPFMSAGWMGYVHLQGPSFAPLSRMSSMDGQGRGRTGGRAQGSAVAAISAAAVMFG